MSAPGQIGEAPAVGWSVNLSPEVLSRLQIDALEAFKALPRRGLEIGGLLLGRAGSSQIYIEGYVPVESGHHSGPSYRLSESDRAAFAAAFEEHPGTVGIYRTQTRSEVLELEKDDLELFHFFFNGPGGVFLLIHPATRKTELFQPGSQVLPQVSPKPATRKLPLPGKPARRPVLPLATAAICVFLGVVAGIALTHFHSTVASTVVAAPRVDLDVQRVGEAVRLGWDRNSPLVRSATSTLTGCSVKVHGLKATPTVIHANARGTYTNAYTPTLNAAPGHLSDQQKHAIAEAHASHQAQTGINAMLGAAVGGQGVVTKGDYVGQATLPNIKAAGKKMDFGPGYKLKSMKPDLHSNVKLQSGGFVYGVLGAGGWDFYYQASLAVKGKAVQKGAFKHGTKALINEEAVLGPPTQIF